MQRAFFSDQPVAADAPAHCDPITVPEMLGVALLAGVSLVIGLYPRLLLDVIHPAVQALPHLLQTGGRA
jgi:NADH-quinone oxidoreductase subunit M